MSQSSWKNVWGKRG